MTEEFRAIVSRHAKRGVIVDTAVLLLYFVGRFAPEQIPRFKRTNSFSIDDYKILALLLRRFDRLLTTPNVLAEVSNFSGQMGDPLRTAYFERFRSEIYVMHEEYVPSRNAADATGFVRLGLTDTTIHLLAKEAHLVLTVDTRLYQFLQSQNIDVINFNHLRIWGWNWLAQSRSSQGT